ncbi:MAG: transcriptional regulator [Lachnospiraceae bacterium]|nr:transcriptional regulator [Lachnospiraceae bacterium]
MKSIASEMDTFKLVLKVIAEQFGSRCEVCLHDWSKGYDSSIVAIENGHVTHRKVGDSGSNLGLTLYKTKTDSEDHNKFNYITKTKDGKTLRSSTVFLKNDEGTPIGALCINLDITDLMDMKSTINELTMGSTEEQELFANDVNELLEFLLDESIKMVGKPVEDLKKQDKMEVLRFLDQRGALLISKSSLRICEFLKISKFTLYNYLDELRNKESDGK